VFEPIIAFNLFQSLQVLTNACSILRRKCIDGITANKDTCMQMVRESCGLTTALVPRIGYEAAADLAREALQGGKSIYDLVLEKGLLSEEELCECLDPSNMTCPRNFEVK
jgi:aspartate ammonia-lyase